MWPVWNKTRITKQNPHCRKIRRDDNVISYTTKTRNDYYRITNITEFDLQIYIVANYLFSFTAFFSDGFLAKEFIPPPSLLYLALLDVGFKWATHMRGGVNLTCFLSYLTHQESNIQIKSASIHWNEYITPSSNSIVSATVTVSSFAGAVWRNQGHDLYGSASHCISSLVFYLIVTRGAFFERKNYDQHTHNLANNSYNRHTHLYL